MIGFKKHIEFASLSCVIFALLQAISEWFLVLILYRDEIFRPIDLIFRFKIFSLLQWILHIGKPTSLALVLNEYLGPGLLNKFPLLIKLASIYSLIGIAIGVFQACVLWLFSRFQKKGNGKRNLFLIHLSVALGIACFLNLFVSVFQKHLLGISVLFQIFTICGLLLVSVLLAKSFYLMSSRLLDRFPAQLRQKSALIGRGLFVLVICLQGIWIPNLKSRQGKQPEAFAKSIQPKNLANASNIILISVDSLRADHLSCYGYQRTTSPNVDLLAREGTLFTRALSVTSWTLPAHLSMLTSLTPESLGVYGMHDKLDPERITLAEILQKNGYTTAGFVSAPFLYSFYGYNQGFDHYDDYTINFDPNKISESNELSHSGITSPALTAAIRKWLRKNHERRFFLFLHYWDVHYDYIPPPPYDTMFDRRYKGTIDGRNFNLNPEIRMGMKWRDLAHVIALYDGEVAFTDSYIGKLIAALKEFNIFDNSLIIFTADHGDEFFEHGGKGHRRTLYDEVLRVPLIIKFPAGAEFPQGKIVNSPASILDIMPTILNYVGLKVPVESDGQELLSSVKGEPVNSNRSLFASLRHDLYAVQSGNSKFIANLESFEKELYDLSNDPREQKNLLQGKNKDKIEQHERILLDWLNQKRQKYRTLPRSQMDTGEISEELERQLRSLGYIQ